MHMSYKRLDLMTKTEPRLFDMEKLRQRHHGKIPPAMQFFCEEMNKMFLRDHQEDKKREAEWLISVEKNEQRMRKLGISFTPWKTFISGRSP